MAWSRTQLKLYVNPGILSQIFPPTGHLLKKSRYLVLFLVCTIAPRARKIFGTFSCVHNRTPGGENVLAIFQKVFPPQLQNEKKTRWKKENSKLFTYIVVKVFQKKT